MRFTRKNAVQRAEAMRSAGPALAPALKAPLAGTGRLLCASNPDERLEWTRGADVQATWRRFGWRPPSERGFAREGFLDVLLASSIGVGLAWALVVGWSA